jgi:hypothetical protein
MDRADRGQGRDRDRDRGLLLLLVLAVVPACQRDAAAPTDDQDGSAGSERSAARSPREPKTAPKLAATQPPAELKLVELLDAAEVRSALNGAAPADLDAVRGRHLLSLDFERASEARLGWKRGANRRIVKRGDGKGRAVRVGGGRGQPLAFLVAVAPQRFVRVERWRRGPQTAPELVVVETTVKPRHKRLNHPADLNRALSRHTMAGSHVNLAVLVRQHSLTPTTAAAGTWQRAAVDLFTGADTRSLLLLLQPPPAAGQSNSAAALFDDIKVTALEPTANQRLALVRQRYGLSAGAQGLRAFGQFLPRSTAARPAVQDSRPASDPERELNFEYRHALLAPAPTSITWTLDVPPEARLSFGVAALPESAADALATTHAVPRRARWPTGEARTVHHLARTAGHRGQGQGRRSHRGLVQSHPLAAAPADRSA